MAAFELATAGDFGKSVQHWQHQEITESSTGRVSSDANNCYRPQRCRPFNVFSFDAQTRNKNIRQIAQSSTTPNEIRALPGEPMMWAARADLDPRLCLQELPRGLVVGPSMGRWLGWEDSNLRMAVPKTAALPLGYTPIRRSNRHNDTTE